MALKTANLGVAFLLELCMLAALLYWGFQAGGTPLLKIILGIGAPIMASVIWGLLMAPQSPRRLTGATYLLLKLIIFGLAVIGLAVASQVTLAIIFAIIAVINEILLIVWKQDALPQ